MRQLLEMARSIAAVAAIAIGLGALAPVSVGAAPPPWLPVTATGTAYGKKFKDWSAEWWQYVLSFPLTAAENPILDATGARCTVGQRGPVWFLMGTLGGPPVTRTCSIPEGKALFFPAINLVDVNVTTQTAAELRAEIAPCLDAVTTLSVELNGKPVSNLVSGDLKKGRVKSSAFAVTLPDDNFLPAGTYSPVVDDGFYVMLKPLPPGTHRIDIIASRGGCLISPAQSVEVIYILTVVPVSLE